MTGHSVFTRLSSRLQLARVLALFDPARRVVLSFTIQRTRGATLMM